MEAQLLPLESEDFQRMLDHVHELKPSLRDTIAGADQVWAHLSTMIRALADSLPWKIMSWRLDRLDATEHKHLEQVFNSLERTLENGEDPRPFLAGTYTCYRKWRDQMADVADIFGHSLALTPGSIPWQTAERRFLDELRRKLQVPVLQAVQKVINEYDQKSGPPQDLSRP